ncbi:hypothetical protein ACT2FY_36080 [Paraburkholderia fungorum]|uniref:hypothetical protein n=1 Tax=Paraburkholderia fungorum TaxID=134537 RepID=UPI00402BDC86
MAWTEIAGYQVLKQTERSSCGMACVAMAIHRTGHGKPSESAIKAMSSQYAGNYSAAIHDRAPYQGASRMLTATLPVQLGGYEGSFLTNLGAVLTAYHVSNTVAYRDQAGLSAAWALVTTGKPAIAQVDWDGGAGSHFVLIEKYDQGAPKPLIVCDPFYGLVSQAESVAHTYEPVAGVSGVFNGWLLQTT